MTPIAFVADRGCFADASDLIAVYGDDAGFEAAARADRSRDIGNLVNYCRWRQIERMIVLLATHEVVGSVH